MRARERTRWLASRWLAGAALMPLAVPAHAEPPRAPAPAGITRDGAPDAAHGSGPDFAPDLAADLAAGTGRPGPPGMRVAEHPGYVRVMFDLPHGSTAQLSDNGGALFVTFSASGAPVLAPKPPRLITGMERLPGEAVLKLAPGVQVAPMFLPDRLVIDLLDPARNPGPQPDSRTSARASERPAPARPAPAPAQTAMAQGAPAQGAMAQGAMAQSGTAQAAARPPASLRAGARAGVLLSLGEHARAAPAPAPAPAIVANTPSMPPSAPSVSDTATVRGAAPPAPGPAAPPHAIDDAEDASPAPTVEPPLPARAPGLAEGLAAPAPPAAANGSLAIAARRLPPADTERAAMVLPFGATVGAAAFPAEGSAILVFDERRPIDLSPVREDDVLMPATVQVLPEATLVRLPLAAGTSVRLARRPDGWRVAVVGAGAPELSPITQDVADGRMHLAAAAPGGVVVVPDEVTGGTLLVGTQRAAGQAVLFARRLPEFALRPDWQGVVVEPVTDQLTLRGGPDGFTIAADARGLPLAPQDQDDAAELDAANFTRRFDLPAAPPAVLSRRLSDFVSAASAAPAQARLRPRLDAAQAMLALGLGAEAQAVVHAAVADAPRGVDDPDAIALGAMAALLAGRPDEAGGLDDPRLDGSDEIALWRAIRLATAQPNSPAAALALKRAIPLLRAYPAPLRARLLPLALRTMAQGGQAKAVIALLPNPQEDSDLELARAMALAATARDGGDPSAALAALDALALSPDRLTRARAATEAVTLRLDTGRMTAGQAADALDRLLFSWRGDEREIDLRLRVAELRRHAGQFRPSLTLLRESEQLWPERKSAIHARRVATFSEALARDGDAAMTPLDLVAMVDENPDLLPDGDAGRALAMQLADRLLALDLPARAAQVMESLLATTASGEARAELGDRLARARLAQGDPAGALDALDKTRADDLPPAARARRALTFARATARQGNAAAAAAALADVDTTEALDLRASLSEQARDWPGALASIKAYAARVLPADGKLDDAGASVLLREASIAAEAGDQATLARLRAQADRLPSGRIADKMTLLTGKPLHEIADLPMVAKEAAVARDFAATLKPAAAPAAPAPAATP